MNSSGRPGSGNPCAACQTLQTPSVSDPVMHLQQTKVVGWKKGGTNGSRRLFIIPFIDTAEAVAKVKRIQKKNSQDSNCCHGRERIISAAVRLANGSVFSGLFDADAVEKARIAHANQSAEPNFHQLFMRAKDGFITSKERFIRPSEAYRVAVKSGQITRRSYAHSVETLWGIKAKGGTLNAVAFNDCRVA